MEKTGKVDFRGRFPPFNTWPEIDFLSPLRPHSETGYGSKGENCISCPFLIAPGYVRLQNHYNCNVPYTTVYVRTSPQHAEGDPCACCRRQGATRAICIKLQAVSHTHCLLSARARHGRSSAARDSATACTPQRCAGCSRAPAHPPPPPPCPRRAPQALCATPPQPKARKAPKGCLEPCGQLLTCAPLLLR